MPDCTFDSRNPFPERESKFGELIKGIAISISVYQLCMCIRLRSINGPAGKNRIGKYSTEKWRLLISFGVETDARVNLVRC